ncbi:hypothetical protein SAPIO_CDS4768 [Scedosporium apiospermum]|uniref:Fungal N-terminal domain-containing protein n=1 Tax=Pseudallescheria apiosperma TaxID=563466 RepID=A0A084G7L0_PSEDA|nr:uncharacterized protein SAPIO_CDS4768 [Scedosporium apiospermum]KEZ43322.1 hypothetical protein SAPIO_CDS4768 [Scedosporium apiospermum]
MTGLETLAAVSSIFQVISFGRETISLCKKIYRTGSGVDSELAENAAFLGHLSSQIYQLEDTTKATSRTKDDQSLDDILKKCQTSSRDLQEEVGFITGHAKNGSLASTLKVAAKTTWRKRRLDRVERQLGDIQRLVEAGLLVRICSNRVDLGQQQLDALDADLRSFLLKYQAGERTVTGLISTESLRTRHHISSEVSRLEGSLNLHTAETRNSAKDVKKHVSQTASATMETFTEVLHNLHLDDKRQENRERFLKSLKFPGMNERRQQIPESFPRTFRWVFGDEALGDGALGEDVKIDDDWESGTDWGSDVSVYSDIDEESDDSGGKSSSGSAFKLCTVSENRSAFL